MLFSSFEFIFLFLPLALAGFAIARRFGTRWACGWLVVCSLAFYAWWNVGFVALLIGSIAINSAMGHLIGRAESPRLRNQLLALGVALNIGLLVWFKYLEPVIHALQAHHLVSADFDLKIILPLGLSFFTFTQIGYLVDRRDGVGEDLDIVRYAAFVTFFPHLIAGPILHVRDIGPQLNDAATLRVRWAMVAAGLTLFAMGLGKKVLLADPLAEVVSKGYGDPQALGMMLSWFVALSYSAQLYFDFSGYSDMAIGLAAMFGIRFPANFNSPYKSKSIIEYWQRWHISLSRYLNLLLYNPVAMAIARWRLKRGKGVRPGSRKSLDAFLLMVVTPTLFTMGLAGIWHGAGLQFLIFGLLHGAYLVVNHAWRLYGPKAPKSPRSFLTANLIAVSQVGLTYLAVLVGSVFFRGASAANAVALLSAMVGANGLGLPQKILDRLFVLGDVGRAVSALGPAAPSDFADNDLVIRLVVSFAIIWALPNTLQILGERSPVIGSVHTAGRPWMMWRPNAVWALLTTGLLFICIIQMRQTGAFLYFQF